MIQFQCQWKNKTKGLLKTLEYERAFECSTCKYVFNVQADLEQVRKFKKSCKKKKRNLNFFLKKTKQNSIIV